MPRKTNELTVKLDDERARRLRILKDNGCTPDFGVMIDQKFDEFLEGLKNANGCG